MADRYEIGAHFEAFVESQLASGRCLDAEIDLGIADLEAGRIHDADEVFDALEARYGAMITRSSSQS